MATHTGTLLFSIRCPRQMAPLFLRLIALLYGTSLVDLVVAQSSPWPMFLGGPTHGGRSSLVGPLSSPGELWTSYVGFVNITSSAILLGDGTVIISTDGQSQGTTMYALHPDTGVLRWSWTDENGGGLSTAALSPDGSTLIVRTSPVGGAGIKSFLSAVNASTGALKWSLNIPATAFTSQPITSPVIASGPGYGSTIFVGGQTSVMAIDLSGTILWTRYTSGIVRDTPAIGAAFGFVHAASTNTSTEQYELLALDGATGELKWRFNASGAFLSSPAVINKTVYIGCYDRTMRAFDELTGAMLWEYQTGTLFPLPFLLSSCQKF